MMNKVAAIKQERRQISELNPAVYNPRKRLAPGDEEYQRLKNSIQTFGYCDPIIINADGTVIGGHQRLFVLRDLGFEYADVAVVDLSKADEKALNIALNKISGEWDEEKLAELFADLKAEDYDLSLTGFSNDEVASLTQAIANAVDDAEKGDPDDAPPVDESRPPVTKAGDVWQLGRHRLICGDSTDKETVLKLLDGEKADLVFTDPPYGMKKEADGVANDNLNYDDLLEFNKRWIPITFDALKENGSWYCWGIDEPLMDIYSHILKPMQKANKITFRNLITWKKENDNPTMLFNGACSSNNRSFYTNEKCLFVMCGVQGFNNNSDNYFEGYEPIRKYLEDEAKKAGIGAKEVKHICGVGMYAHWFTKSQWDLMTEGHYKKIQEYCENNGVGAFLLAFGEIKKQYEEIKKDWYNNRAFFDGTASQCVDVWAHDVTSAEERKSCGKHATPKPVALCGRAIKSSSREGEIVLDVFGGSGSTLIACEQFGRTARLVELEPKWCDVIVRRYAQVTGKTDITLIRDGESFPVEQTGILD